MGGIDISVIIPTRGRPGLLKRAIRSVVAQTFEDWELIVVIDGLDVDTAAVLDTYDDARVRVLQLPESRGGAGARNAGVGFARGEWIAFLDDDDEWMPDKLAVQRSAASRSGFGHPVIASRVIARTPRGDFVWPRRLKAEHEPIGDYLFARNSLFQGEALVQTSTLLVRRESLLAVPFTEGLQRHQDWDWLLRALHTPGFRLEFADGPPLAVWYIEEARRTISTGQEWQPSLEWIDDVAEFLTPRAFAAFVLVIVGAYAARQGDRSAFRPLLRKAFASGRPRPLDLLLFLGIWAIPQDLRRTLRSLTAKRREARSAAALRP